MTDFIDFLIELLKQWAEILPLPVFVFIGALLEEILAPIPSPLVMTLAGSVAEASGLALVLLPILALIGAVGKTIGAYGIYWLANKFEHILTGRFGKFIGVSHKQVLNLNKRLEKGGRNREWLVIFTLRALPIMPTAPVSFAAGILQLKQRVYLISTFAGLIMRNLFYLYLGYTSVGTLEKLNDNLDSFESIGYIIILIIVAAIIFYIYKNRKHDL